MKFFLLGLILWSALPAYGAKVNVSAELIQFKANASYTHFYDGSYEVAHVSRFEIETPLKLRGNQISLYHQKTDDVVLANAVSKKVSFAIEQTVLEQMVSQGSSVQVSFSSLSDSFRLISKEEH